MNGLCLRRFDGVKLFILLCCCGVSCSYAQAYKTATEIGVFAGGASYIGELSHNNPLMETSLAYGLVYRYNFSTRYSLRATALYGKIKGDDANSSIQANVNRNLSFESPILELAVGCELDLFNYRITDMKYPISPYFFYQVAYTRINPSTNYNGNKVDLQPLGTEGQGTVLSEKSKYKLNQFSIPLGIGLKLNITKGLAVSFEYGIRKTFTDYLDDVSGYYVDQSILRAENGPLAANLADRSIESNGLNRGNPRNKDWYSFYGVMLTFKPFKRDICVEMKGR